MAPLAGVLDCSTSVGGLIIPPTMSVVVDPPVLSVKCVLVGDGAVGKTSLLASYAISEYPTDYRPTAFDNYTVVVRVDDLPIRLQLRDTAGQLELDSLRTLCYADADVFLLCFNVACLESFDAVTSRWLPEIRRLCPTTPIVLVGTQSDRRRQLPSGSGNVIKTTTKKSCKSSLVSQSKAERLANKIGAAAYVECSASEQTKVKDVFDTALVVTLDQRGLLKGHPAKNGKRKTVDRGLDISRDDLKSTSSVGKTADSDDDRKQHQQRYQWKKLLCCSRR